MSTRLLPREECERIAENHDADFCMGFGQIKTFSEWATLVEMIIHAAQRSPMFAPDALTAQFAGEDMCPHCKSTKVCNHCEHCGENW